MEFNLPYDKILYALVCACHFRAKDEDGIMLKADLDFIESYRKGIKHVLTGHCGFNEINDRLLIIQAEKTDALLSEKMNKTDQ